MNLIEGKRVVVSGVVPGHSRGTAQAFVQNAGAFVQSSMNGETDILIIGGKPGPKKIDKAASMGIQVLTWEQMLAALDGDEVSADANAPVEVLDNIRVVSPQKALQADEVPDGEGWIHEVKWDGYRCVATVKGGRVAMQSRSGLSEYLAQFPKVAAELAQLTDCVLDGELIVLGADGTTSFETAHTAATGTEAFMVFDILELGGEDLRALPLIERRVALTSLIEGWDDLQAIRVSPAHHDGAWLLAWVNDQSLEGVVSKRIGSRYVEGSRTDAWQKIKVRIEQEFVILGWKPGDGRRAGMAGSILLGVREDGGWKFVGRCGTGGEDAIWQGFAELPEDPTTELVTDTATAKRPELRDVTWVEPTTVVQIEFQRWTKDDRLWHPSLLRIRTDKEPMQVVREG